MEWVIKMNEQQYQKTLNWCRKNKKRERVLTLLCQYSPISVIIIYIGTLLYLIFNKSYLLVETIVYPLAALIITTIIRKIINAPRPYDIYNINPLISHHSGESFPSRHTACATIIAFACFNVNYVLGIICFLISIYVGMSRIIGGVHFIKDVLAGALISSLLGLILILF